MMRDSNTLLIGTRKGLIRMAHTNNEWRIVDNHFAGSPVPYAASDHRTGALWASLDHGHWGSKLHRSTDNGKSWQELSAPAYPEGAERSGGGPATLRYIWVLTPGGADQPTTFYAGTEPGGLFRSDDYGESFQLVEGLWNHPSRLEGWFGGGRDYPGIHSIIVDPRNSNRVLVGISCAGMFETTDGGTSWQPRNGGLRAEFLPNPETEVGQDPHLITACGSNPDVLWQQNHCGIYRSIDGGAHWSYVSQPGGPAHFGFPIAVDQHNGDVAWVVPAESDERRMAIDGALCISRTDDGGASWTTFRNGLPQQGCFDVVFRHALDNNGDTLAFGTTSGNLFVSDDRGESWKCIGNYLPPIYSVRFSSVEA